MRKKMKEFGQLFVVIFLAVACLTVHSYGQNQVALSETDLGKHTYYFDIVGNQFVGDGAKLLADEMKKTQFVLLGEYHDSLRISEFTKSPIPVFHDAGGRIDIYKTAGSECPRIVVPPFAGRGVTFHE